MRRTRGDAVTDRADYELCKEVDQLQFDAHDSSTNVRRSPEAQELIRRGKSALPCMLWRLRKQLAEDPHNALFPRECYAMIIHQIAVQSRWLPEHWPASWTAIEAWIILTEVMIPPKTGHNRLPTDARPDDPPCSHAHYSFDKYGRICTCGATMVDFGD